jgi:hypothetical protein
MLRARSTAVAGLASETDMETPERRINSSHYRILVQAIEQHLAGAGVSSGEQNGDVNRCLTY